jgi:hypothetical protein
MTAHDHDPHPCRARHSRAMPQPQTVRRGHTCGDDGAQAGTAFQELLSEVMSAAERFGHRQHVHLTWLAVRRYGTSAAIDLVSHGIQGVARYAGVPQKYNVTISRARVELVGHHAGQSDAADFESFIDQHSAILDKRLLNHFYRSSTLASVEARTSWVEPDRAPFPWQNPGN